MTSPLSFTGFAWKILWRRRLRTLLTLGGIAMAIDAFVRLAGLVPAWRGAHLSPVETLRHD
jgi:ABC-type lipoprotein release transport system permease subunit